MAHHSGMKGGREEIDKLWKKFLFWTGNIAMFLANTIVLLINVTRGNF